MADRQPRRAASAVGALALFLLAACGAGAAERPPPATGFVEANPDGKNGAVLPDPYVVPDVTLTDTDGEPFSLAEDTSTPVTLVFFGYTHCPDICQIVMADIASAVLRLPAPDREDVAVLLVTSDPSRDDPATLREYLDRFDPAFEGLTGDLQTIVEAANALGVEIQKGARLPSGGYEVAHGTQIVGLDHRGRAPIVWTEGTSAAQLAEDLSELLAQGGEGA